MMFASKALYEDQCKQFVYYCALYMERTLLLSVNVLERNKQEIVMDTLSMLHRCE